MDSNSDMEIEIDPIESKMWHYMFNPHTVEEIP